MIPDLVDVLIPGAEGWPSAASIGVQGIVAMRLCESRATVVRQISAAIIEAGGPFEGRTAEERGQSWRASSDAAGPFRASARGDRLAYYERPFVVNPSATRPALPAQASHHRLSDGALRFRPGPPAIAAAPT